MWQRIRSLIVKELLAVLRDPKGRYILIVPPIIQMLVFSVAATQEVKNVRMAVLNEDYGTAARDLVARFEGSTNFSQIRYLRGEADIAPAIDSRSVLMVLHLGPDFSRRLAGGMPAEVQLILDGRRSNAAQIVAGYAQAIFDAFDRELAATRRAPPPPSLVAARVWFNPNLETTWNTVPSLVAILTTLMGLVVTALSVARERELGTFEQLLVSPLQPIEIIVGKTVPALIIGLAEGTVMLLVGIFFFRVPFQGSYVLLYLVDDGLPRRGDRRRPVHLVAGHDAAAGDPGCVHVHGAGDPALRLRHPDREHARVAPDADPGQPVALLHGDHQGRVPQGHARDDRAPTALATGRDRAGDALGGHLAVPPPRRVEIGADDLSVHSSANSSLNGSTKPGSTSPPSSDWPSLIRIDWSTVV